MTIPIRNRIHEDETVFSWVARIFRLSHFVNLNQFYRKYFGVKRVRLHPYLPAHLDEIAQETGSEAETLLMHHTLYPLFLFFNIENEGRLRASMLSRSGQNVISKAALPHSKITFFNGQKYCPKCEKETTILLGFAYYRIEHQIPGVEVCWKHGCYLDSLDGGDFGFDRQLPLVPHNSSIKTAPRLKTKFAKFTYDVLILARQEDEPINYQLAYRNELDRRGMSNSLKRIKITVLRERLANFYQDFTFGTKLGIPAELEDFKFIGPLLREATHSRAHPTKHLLLSFFLFDGSASLYKNYGTPKRDDTETKKSVDEETVLSLLKQGFSMRKITSLTGRSQCFIKRIAELNNIDIRSNSQRFSESIKRAVAIKGFMGIHRNDIANNLKVSVGYVEQVISGTKGLVAWRKHLKQTPRIKSAINEIISSRKLHPDWLRKDIKQQCESAFFSLYHFNKKLLNTILPVKQAPTPHPKDWKKEDERIISELSDIPNVHTFSLSKLDHMVKAKGALIKKMNKLPKTSAFITSLKKNNKTARHGVKNENRRN